MKCSIAAAAIALVAGANAQAFLNATRPTAGAIGAAANAQATAYDTVVVDSYVTTCPGNVASTAFAYNGQTYSATAGQVVTVTNCPCTVTAPAGTIPTATPAPAPQAHYGGNSTVTPEPFTGAASKLSGAGLAAVFAVAAYAL